MTEDDRRQQKMTLLLEYHEAKVNLGYLRRKAIQMARPFRHLSDWLHYAGSIERRLPADGEDPAKIRDVIVANVEEFRAKLDLDAVLAVASQITAAEQLIVELRRQKQELGIND
jgi:hypothetical protein